MQEVKFLTWCDLCAEESEGVVLEPGTVLPVVIDGVPMSVDLCDRHDKLVLGPVRDLMANHGYKDKPSKKVHTIRATGEQRAERGLGPIPCLWCDRSFANAFGVLRHLHTVHGLESSTGKSIPNYGDVFEPQCPWCDKSTASVAGLGSHLAAFHKDKPAEIPATFAAAKRAGDPHGVVARTMAKLK